MNESSRFLMIEQPESLLSGFLEDHGDRRLRRARYPVSTPAPHPEEARATMASPISSARLVIKKGNSILRLFILPHLSHARNFSLFWPPIGMGSGTRFETAGAKAESVEVQSLSNRTVKEERVRVKSGTLGGGSLEGPAERSNLDSRPCPPGAHG